MTTIWTPQELMVIWFPFIVWCIAWLGIIGYLYFRSKK